VDRGSLGVPHPSQRFGCLEERHSLGYELLVAEPRHRVSGYVRRFSQQPSEHSNRFLVRGLSRGWLVEDEGDGARLTLDVNSALVRRGLSVLAVTLVLAAPASAQHANATASALMIRGHGFGHGIGLSQWGAQERAAVGQTYQQILAFYYPGTSLRLRPTRTVRILVGDRAQLRIGSAAPFVIREPRGRVLRLPAGLLSIGPGNRVGPYKARFPIVVMPLSSPVQVGGTRYAGTLTISRANAQHLLAVDTVGLESYVAGVVSSELPASWHAGALRAQAIASRTYALSHLRSSGAFDLYSDDRSQNFHGLSRVFPAAQAATTSTSGQVLLYRGSLVKAEFSASNGGLTSSLTRAWGGPEPYLETRPDPFDARSPRANWGPVRISMTTVRRVFRQVPVNVSRIEIDRNSSDRVASLTFVGADRGRVTVSGPAFQEKLGLLSTYFELTPVNLPVPH
jgi:stage II sporulation protein D